MTARTRVCIAVTVVIYWIALTSCGGGVAGADPTQTGATGPAQATPARTETPAGDELKNEDNHTASGAPQNVVEVLNKSPKKLNMRASVQLNRIKSDSVTPLNAAIAVGQDCVGCQTIAVALQLDLYQQGAHVVAPENYAIALNLNCTSCVTISHAIQYAIPVADPEQDGQQGDQQGSHQDADARRLLQRMQKELDDIAKTKDITADQAETRIRGVLAEFRSLASVMLEDMKRADVKDSESPSPRPSRSPDRALSPTGSVSPAASPTASPSISPTASPTPTPTP
jgi:hypothetical protein